MRIAVDEMSKTSAIREFAKFPAASWGEFLEFVSESGGREFISLAPGGSREAIHRWI
jgi:hypothetical protein